jgi:hypothetical protein
MYRPFGDTRAE